MVQSSLISVCLQKSLIIILEGSNHCVYWLSYCPKSEMKLISVCALAISLLPVLPNMARHISGGPSDMKNSGV